MVYFLRPNSDQNDEVLQLIEFNLLDTTREVRIAVAYFTEPRLTRAITQRLQRGYPTKLILNTSDILRVDHVGEEAKSAPGNIVRLLSLNKDPENIWIRALGRNHGGVYENMHHKFVVSDSWVYFGSLNWTYFALRSNYEVMYVSKEEEIVNKFIVEFEHMWELAEEIYVDDKNRVSKLRCSNCNSDKWIDMNSAGFYCGMCGSNFYL